MGLKYSKDIPVKYTVDVFVAGGGPSGLAAAAIAARKGAKVFLAEQAGSFGGMGVSAGIPFFCHLTDGKNFLAGGFGEEIYNRIFSKDGAGPEMRQGFHPSEIGGFIYNPEVLKRVYDDVMQESGVDFTFNTTLIDVNVENETLTHAICNGKSGVFAVKAKVFIDTTGDGDLSAMAGLPFEIGDEEGLVQASTLCSLWTGIDWSKKKIWTDHKYLPQAIKDGVFSVPDLGLPGILHTVADAGWGNVGHTWEIDPTDERSVTSAMITGRKLALEYEKYYRNYVVGCENAQMLWTAQTLGVRESRRIKGKYTLTIDAFTDQAIFHDEIGRYSYPVDLHGTRAAKNVFETENAGSELYEHYHYKNPGENYGIPYRCLLPEKIDNLLVAGRCISTDRYMHGSVRVQAGCFITGQAAGMAAAIAGNQECLPENINVVELQKSLKEIGAFLPNCD